MRSRLLALFATVGVLLAVHPMAALAATGQIPTTTPTWIQPMVGFETPSNMGTEANQVNAYASPGVPTAAAYWGRITPRHLDGSYGLWCAGSIPASWPAYPVNTRGYANYAVGDTSSYYESWVQFSYIMPTLDPNDTQAFQANWYNGLQNPQSPGATFTVLPAQQYYSISPLWQTVKIVRYGADPDITSGVGTIQFAFKTLTGSNGAGEGPTIDDLGVTGYMYGPVRSLVATRQLSPASTVTLTWAKPVSVPGTTTVDPRSMTYRVWRHDLTTDSWVEVTSNTSRVSALTVDDTNTPLTDTLQYLVQAWDPGTGTNYGEATTSAQIVPQNGTQMTTSFVPPSGTTLQIPYGGQTQVAGALQNAVGDAVTGQAANVKLQTSPDGSAWTTTTVSVVESATAPGTYVATVAPSAATYYRFGFAGGGGYLGCSSSPALQVTLRAATTSWSNESVASSTVAYNGSTTMVGTLNSETGPVIGMASSIVLQTSANGTTWSNSSAVVSEISPAVYSVALTGIKPPAYFRFHLPSGTNYAESFSDAQTVATRGAIANWTGVTQNGSTSSPSIPYGGSVTIAGTLNSETGPVPGKTTIVARYSTTGGSTWTTSTATVTEDSPAHYTATVPILALPTDVPLTRLQLYFPGDDYYGIAITPIPPTVPPVTVVNVATNWQNVPTTQLVATNGGNMPVGADLYTATGLLVTGQANPPSKVTLQSSTDGTTGWANVSIFSVAESPAGHYGGTLVNVTSHKYYRWVFAGTPSPYNASTSATFEVTSTASPATTITNAFGDTGSTALTLPIHYQTVIYGPLKDSGNQPVTGQAGNVVVQTSPTGSVWTTASASVASSTVESATTPGTYQVTVSANATPPTLTYYRLAFAGAGAYSASQASSPLTITTRAATTSWSGVPTSASVGWGGSTQISGSLGSETGPVTSTSGAVTVQQWNGASWVTTTTASSDSPAHYTATLSSLAASAQFRLHYAGDTAYGASDSATFTVTVTPATSSWTGVSGPVTVPYGGSTVITATLNAGGNPLSGKAGGITLLVGGSPSGVSVAENPPSSGQYTATLSNVTASGNYTFSFGGEASHYTSAVSAGIAVTKRSANTSWTGAQISASAVPLNGTPPTIDATLQSETGALLSGIPGSIQLQSSPDSSFATTTSVATTITDLGSAHYRATLPNTPTGTKYYRLYYVGDSNYNAAGSTGFSLEVGKTPASWSVGPEPVTPTALSGPGGSVTIKGTLTGGASTPLTGRAAQVVVMTSPDGITWTTAAAAMVESPAGTGTYAGTISNVQADTYLELVWPGDATYASATYQYPDKITVGHVPTFRNELGVPGTVAYNGAVTLGGDLYDMTNALMPGQSVVVQQSWDGVNGWATVGAAAAESPSSSGHYQATIGGIGQSAYYRLFFGGSTDDPSGAGASHFVMPHAYVTNLSSLSSIKHTKYLAISGKISRARGTRTIIVRAYHKEKVRKGKKTVTAWVLRAKVNVGIAPGSGVYSYKTRLKLSRTGSWYLQASLSDGYTLPALTTKRNVKSK